MKFSQSTHIRFCDCGPDGAIRPGHLTRYLHEAAGRHSLSCGDGAARHAVRHTAWILHKFGMRISRLPKVQEEVEISTWSREPRGFKALREYSLSVNGGQIVTGTSVWLLIDLMDNRLLRVNDETLAMYEPEGDVVSDMDLEKWKPSTPSTFACTREFNLRANDIDLNRHVNNSVYFDLLESIVESDINEVRVEYVKAVEPGQKSLTVGISPDGNFMVWSGDVVFVKGMAVVTFPAFRSP